MDTAMELRQRLVEEAKSGYEIYDKKAKLKTKMNLLDGLFPPLPDKRYSIIYAGPAWHYNGKLQYDKSSKIENNKGWNKDIFVSAAAFKYPTIKTDVLKTLDVCSIAEKDSLLFMWATNPHLQQAIELGITWGFEYKTVAFIWNKCVHNPGQYTLSYCELCLLFKRGRIPTPREARNIKQLISVKRARHSEKPPIVARNIEMMFPRHKRIELFARCRRRGWDAWGLESIYSSRMIFSKEDASTCTQNVLL